MKNGSKIAIHKGEKTQQPFRVACQSAFHTGVGAHSCQQIFYGGARQMQ